MIDEKYMVDHLFLLVGKNPLPNYVATRLLVKNSQRYRIFFVFSDDTSIPRKALEEVLRKHGYENFTDVKVEEANPINIRNLIEEYAKDLEGIVGLNYTGGTKVMAVHAYQVLHELSKPKPHGCNLKVQYSYLDARTLSMRMEGTGIEKLEIIEDASSYVSITIRDIMELHGLNDLKQQMNNDTVWYAIASELVEIHADKEKEKTWRLWCQEALRRDDRPDKFLSSGKLKLLSTDSFPFDSIREAFQHEYPDRSLPLTFAELAQASSFEKVSDKLAKWFDGIWLEHYVFCQLLPLKQDGQVQDLWMTINPSLRKGDDSPDFEFDVACVRGYQLFALTCTSSSDPKLCKSKLLEAIIRAEQLGGIEARVALICCVDSPDNLRDQVSELLHQRRLRVFGRQHLRDLGTYIGEWIEEASKGK